ncbi:hypothetical protein [Cupriavidus sp. BIS7]|uniref:hypothetical protein n=1 Tax=Cupriavidus sp. BIS7 TaxID=1217718 RepID=UPI0003779C3F|nr:hypothetical protein [Cupriavidus sp. BIS7]
MKKLIIATTGAALLSGNAMAEIIWKDYKTAGQQGADRVMNIYIAGASESLGAANAQLQIERKPLLYCQPRSLSLNTGNVRAMLDNDQSRVVARLTDDVPLSTAVFYVLRETFPCK